MFLELAMPLVTTGHRNLVSEMITVRANDVTAGTVQISDCKGVGNVGEMEEQPSLRDIQE